MGTDRRQLSLTKVPGAIADPIVGRHFENWRRDLVLQLPQIIEEAVSAANVMTAVGLRKNASFVQSGVPTDLSWEITDYNNGGTTMFNPALSDRLIAPENGLYHVYASVEWEFGAAGTRSLQIIENAANTALVIAEGPPCQPNPPLSFPFTSCVASRHLVMVAGDYVRCRVFQNSGAILQLMPSSQAPIFGLTRLSGFP
jgi:hypothetical protein